ncbi:hypothetical protein E5163_07185 [Marinicauda algicola]|uniref:STAS/SEC14 domain-containing protein n=1 Tax=Marinicauda algicola TaxID=2029849 RepID=A0A4S2H0K6_9PROT|nr:hypothetical protein [Marinicauda algicola]TGY88913.1 hypothetical protein E5163_07185 [Marinicauda algicola]
MDHCAPPGAEIDYDGGLRALVVTVRGDRTVEMARSLMAAMQERMRAHGTNRLLFDGREAAYQLDLQESIDAFLDISRAAEGWQIALLFALDQRETGVIMQTTGTTRWNLVRLFHDVQAARDWLAGTSD